MRKFMILALALVMSILPLSPVHAAAGNTYYVAPTGNDASPGTKAQPWKTIQKAVNTAAAGDTINLAAGSFNENVTVTISGTAEAPIIIQGLSSPNFKQSTPTTTACLDAANSCILGIVTISGSQIVFRNIEVAGPPVKPGIVAGITVKGSNDEISNNFVHNSWREGIAIRASTSYNRVLNNNIMYGVVSGIYFDGQNHLIQGNTITHSVTRPADRIALSGGTDPDGIRFFGSGSVVRKNTIKDIYLDESPAVDAPHQDCFQSWGNAVNISFEQNYCELENSTISTTPMVKFFMIERQTTTNIDNIRIVNNIFVSKSTATLWTPINIGNNSCSTSYPLTNITIENNTFVHPGNVVADFAILMRCTNTATIRNNALYNFGNSSYPYIYQDQNNNTNVTISNNSVYNSNGTAPKGGANPGDTALWMKNPLFASDVDFHLQAGSPLIDSGFNDGIISDYDGSPRPQGSGYDVGSYETGSAALPPPTQPSETQTPVITSTPAPTLTATPTAIVTLPSSGSSDILSVCKSGCAYTTIQSAVNAAVPGQTIEVQDGTYNESVTIPSNGTSSKWITLRAKAGSTVWIDGSTLGNVSNINLGNHSYWNISGLKMRLAANGSPLNADGQADGVTVGVGGNNILLQGLTIEAPNSDGIDLRGANYNIQVVNNEVYDMRKANPSYTGDGHGIHVLQQVGVAATHDILVKGNFVHDAHGKACLAVSDFTALNAPRPTNVVFEYNKVQDCTNGIKINADGIFRYNLVVDTGKYTTGVEKPDNCFQAFTHDAENNVRNAQVYNNTTVGCNNAYNFDMTYNGSTPTQTFSVFRNNIAYNPRVYFVRVSNTLFGSDGSNLFYSSNGRGSYIGYTPGSDSIVNTDPLFNPDFTLSSSSPAIDRGAVIDASLSYFGSAPDIGAFEAASSGVVIIPVPTQVTPTLSPTPTPTSTLQVPIPTPTTQAPTPKPTNTCKGSKCRK